MSARVGQSLSGCSGHRLRLAAAVAAHGECDRAISHLAPQRLLQARPSAQVLSLKRRAQWALFSRFSYKVELAPSEAPEGLKLATFAGGCFWGLELAYQRVPGVVKTSVGYTGGDMTNPTYETVCMGITGHTEAVQVTYNPEEVTYGQLLDLFFDRVDVTTLNRQGNDMGTQYRSGIYYHDDQQREEAAKRMAEVDAQLQEEKPEGAIAQLLSKLQGKKVVTELERASNYYLAEEYHQQYLAKGGRFNSPQSTEKGCTDTIRCYG